MKWPPLVNVSTVERRMMTTHDGREVPSDSEEWRAECEARFMLKMRTKQHRHSYLEAVEKRRGADSRRALERLVMLVWESDRAKSGQQDRTVALRA